MKKHDYVYGLSALLLILVLCYWSIRESNEREAKANKRVEAAKYQESDNE